MGLSWTQDDVFMALGNFEPEATVLRLIEPVLPGTNPHEVHEDKAMVALVLNPEPSSITTVVVSSRDFCFGGRFIPRLVLIWLLKMGGHKAIRRVREQAKWLFS